MQSNPPTDDKWIDVDISDQTITAYMGGTPLKTVLDSRGVASHPTVIGQYKIEKVKGEGNYVRGRLSDVHRQEHVKGALEIAGAGQHNVLVAGTLGASKTLLARSMPSILPSLTLEGSLDYICHS